MKKAWKWILGIVIGILVVCLILAAVPFFMHNFGGGSYGMMGNYGRGGDFDGWGRHPMMGGRGGYMPFYGGFFLLGGLFRLLIPLALLGLVGSGIFTLGKRSVAPAVVNAAPVTAPAVEPAVEASGESVSTRACARCGKPVQDDWTTCPYCGTSI